MESTHHCNQAGEYSMNCKEVRGMSKGLQREGLFRT